MPCSSKRLIVTYEPEQENGAERSLRKMTIRKESRNCREAHSGGEREISVFP